MIVKGVKVLSCARIVGTIYAIFGLIAGIFISVATLVGIDLAAGSEAEMAWFRVLFGAGAVLVLPVVYGVLGYLGGLIGAWVYNKAADAMGGLELEVE